MADIHIFVYFGFFRSGGTPGIPKGSLDHLVHICKHKDKIANVPQVKDTTRATSGVGVCR
ncbi:hypothetical protein DIPPA_18185 [Diplonema papillatum]|nr:hypothetical protein DIPPA_18185 [Diplonema papillatum]